MKKISKIKISDRYIRTKWYVKAFIILLTAVLIIMLALLIKFYFDLNNGSSKPPDSDNIIIADFDAAKNNYTIFRTDDGMAGVKDINDRYVIEPEWDNIYFLNGGRFAVSQKNNNKLTIGIIDSEENIIMPFVFGKIVSIGNSYLAAYFESGAGFAFLDTNGNMLSEKIWDSFEYDEKSNKVTLLDITGKYSYRYVNDILVCTDVDFSKTAAGCSVNYMTDDMKLIERISPDRMCDIFNLSCSYLTSVFSGNISAISELTDEQFMTSLSANNLFKNCTIINIKNLSIKQSDDNSDEYIFSAEILYDYRDGDKIIENLKSLVTLNFVTDENHRVILKSINKREL